MRLVLGRDADVAYWTASHIPHVHGFGLATAIGVEKDGDLVAGIVYSDYNPIYKTMQVSMAAIDPRWAQKGVIRALLHYPFEQVGIRKLWSIIPQTNERALRFNVGIGFKKEATLANQFGDDHAIVTRMFRGTYERRYKVKSHGNKKHRDRAACA